MIDTFDHVVISERGGGRSLRVPIAAPQASWEINGTGSFSGFITVDTLFRSGLGRDLRGHWIAWQHPWAGRWGGVITGMPITDTIVELAADGWLALLRGRVLNEGELVSRPPGGLAHLAIIAAGRTGATFLDVGTIDNGGASFGLTLNGDVAEDLLPQIAEGGGVEWTVDADRVFHCARRLGQDRSATIRLVEDRQIVGVHTDDDMWTTAAVQKLSLQDQSAPVASSVAPPSTTFAPLSHLGVQEQLDNVRSALLPEGIPSGSGALASPNPVGWGFVQTLQPGIVGGFAVTAVTAPPPWVGQPPGIGANTVAQPGVPHMPPPSSPMELTLARTGPLLVNIGLGDTVGVDVGSMGFRGRFRVLVKAIDAASGVVALAGEAMRG